MPISTIRDGWPVLVREGFRGRVFCTPATADLLRILLPDSAALQEEDAERANRRGYTKHAPAMPLYGRLDAERALERLEPVEPHVAFAPAPGFEASFARAGHILGAASLRVRASAGSILFSGDLGRPSDELMRAPEPPGDADWFVLESTYGDRRHEPSDPLDRLGRTIAKVTRRGGVVMIASFAGRPRAVAAVGDPSLKAAGRIPKTLPVFLKQPMATDVTALYRRHRREHRLSAAEVEAMRGPRPS